MSPILVMRLRHIDRQLFSNILWQSLAQVFARLFNLLIFLLVANILGVEGLGRFTFAIAFAQAVGVFIDFGMNPVLIRTAVSGEAWGMFKTFSLLKVFLSLLFGSTAFFVGKIVFDYNGSDALGVALALGAITSLSFLNLLFSLIRARQEMAYEAFFTLLQRLIYLLLALSTFFIWGMVNAVLAAYAFSGLLTVIILYRFVVHRYGERDRKAIRVNRTLLGQILPLLVIDLFTLVYFRIDTLMLQSMKGYTEVGIYNAGYRLFEALILVPSILAIAFFPRLVKDFTLENGVKQVRLYLTSFALLGVLAVAILFPSSGLIFNLIYGFRHDFSASLTVFQLLLIAFVLVCLNYPITQIAIASGNQRTYAVAVIAASLVNIGLNYLTIPKFGAPGASLVTIVTEFSLFLFMLGQLKRAWTGRLRPAAAIRP